MVLFATPETAPLALNCWPARFGIAGCNITPSFWQCQATALWDPEGNVPGNVRGDVRHFAWLHPPALVGRNRWCCLLPRKPPRLHWPGIAGRNLTPSFWQCQATVLWDPEGNVPGNVRGDVRHFAWLHPPPVPTGLLGRNRWCCLLFAPPETPPLALANCWPARFGIAGCNITPSFWQCQATVLWDPEGNVPGNVRGDVKHFAWLHPPPVPTALVGRNRWCCLLRRVQHHTELLAMPGNCFWDPEGNVPGNVRGDVKHFAWLHPPRSDCSCGQK